MKHSTGEIYSRELRPFCAGMGRVILLALLIVLLVACNLLPGKSATPTLTGASTTVTGGAFTAVPKVTPSAASTPTSSATLAPTVSATSTVSQTIRIYLIAIGDNGQTGKAIGCDDSVVAVERQIAPTQQVLRAAFADLLSLKQRDYGESGLINALYQADLKIESITITDGVAEIKLTGSMMLSGVCDIPRVEAQLTETALQFATIKVVNILLNGVPLHEALSLQ